MSFRGRLAQLGIGALGLLAGCVVAVAGHIGLVQLGDNFDTVVAGELYRSAQLDPETLAARVRDNGIRTVINLRGAAPDRQWYQDEVGVATALDVQHFDFKMSARKELTAERFLDLVELLREAPKPILVHCRAGADRSGLVSAIYVAAVAAGGEEAAERQLSLRHGHLPIPYFTAAFAMDRTWERIEAWLGFEGT